MRTSKMIGAVCAGLFALTLGAQQAGALVPTPPPMQKPTSGISQRGSNVNSTTQSADSKATTKQGNLNLPISFFTVGSNDGRVKQWNGADTKATSSNDNATKQKLEQSQKVSDGPEGSKSGGKGPKPGCGKSGDTGGTGSTGFDKGPKSNGGEPGKGSAPSGDVSQRGRNDNWTSQDAQSKATTKQVNVNAPISVFSVDSNNGDVHQGNSADTSAKSSNQNWTDQSLHQKQGVSGGSGEGRPSPKPEGRKPEGKDVGSSDKGGQDGSQSGSGVSQSGKNDNSTSQDATSTATAKQANVNAPISLFSVGSNNGDVQQSNNADTKAKSSNGNWTDQSANQSQWASGNSSPDRSYGSKSDGQKGSNGNGDVSQSGKNDNPTTQDAQSKATTKQANVNLPISLFTVGSNDGGVRQGNSAGTYAGSSNWNGTQQTLGQSQGVGSLLG